MTRRVVYIVGADGDEELTEHLAGPLRDAGYTVVHNGTVAVGESLVGVAEKAITSASPIILCATVKALGSSWAHGVVNAARSSHSPTKVFVMQMERQAYTDQLALDGKVIRYYEDPSRAIRELLEVLAKQFPPIAEESNLTGQRQSVPTALSPYARREPGGGKARLFISYSHRDHRYREQLVTHLAGLRRQGIISDWHDRKIVPGKEWRDAIDRNLDSADCVLLLVSPDFLASDYCYSIEMQRTLERHREGRVAVIPVIVRPADWQHTPLGELEALPKDAKPVVEWAHRDRAWLSVTDGIRRVLPPLSE
jgi:hypothetical protein